jgi:DNA-binding HxlR family transcriptional regulator
MDSPDDLNDTDGDILRLLSRGRETRGSMAAELDRDPNWIGQRLRWLKVHGLIEYRHEPTGLYEITESGEDWVSRLEGKDE